MLRRFLKARDGAVAVEFGLVAIPFFALIFAVIETALIMWASQVLETAVANASREILTGQFQSAQGAAAPTIQRDAFRQKICDNIGGLIDCTNLALDVRRFPSFTDASAAPLPPLTKDGELNTSEFVFEPSQRGEIVVVRAASAQKVFVSLLNPGLADLAGNRRLIAGITAFRNEPF